MSDGTEVPRPAPALPPAPSPAPAPAPAPGVNWSRLTLFTAVAALVIALTALYRANEAMDALRHADRAAGGTMPTIDLADAPILGSDSAVITLVEFSDYECPYCLRHFQQTMPMIDANYVKTGKIRYAFRDWPVDELHPQSIRAHEAAHCANEQNKFWQMHTRLFSPAGSHSPEQLSTLAQSIGLDMGAFNACVAAKRSDLANSRDQPAGGGSRARPERRCSSSAATTNPRARCRC
jgi:protein-disulfide isomerase